jgi:nucleoside-diphosphate-sugar epimerase
MKVLLTGANGFVGSHVLDSLHERGIETVALLRSSSNRRWIAGHLNRIEVRIGSIDDRASLVAALAGITHVIHCAGATKALNETGFFQSNQIGTRNVIEALNEVGHVARLVHISSLAAGHPACSERPALPTDPAAPLSLYGRSKLAGEEEVRSRCRCEFVILRPPAVYGPRDAEFLRLFKAVRSHLLPRIGGGRQQLSLVYVKDLAGAIVACLNHPAAPGKTYYVTSPEIRTAGEFADLIAAQMKTWTLPLPLPNMGLWPVCLVQDLVAKLTRRPSVVGLQKYRELTAPGWVCDPRPLQTELGIRCDTGLKEGVAATLAWYRQEGWL